MWIFSLLLKALLFCAKRSAVQVYKKPPLQSDILNLFDDFPHQTVLSNHVFINLFISIKFSA